MFSFAATHETTSPERDPTSNTSSAVVVPYDILCGRNKHAVGSAGTKRFRETVSRYVPQYASAPSKFKKSIIVEVVVDAIRADGGRFLHMTNEPDGTVAFTELSKKQVRTKVSHALRDLVAAKAKRKRRISAQKGEATNSSNGTAKKSAGRSHVVSTASQQEHWHRPSPFQQNDFSLPKQHQQLHDQQKLPSADCSEQMYEIDLPLGRGEPIPTGTPIENDSKRGTTTTGGKKHTNEERQSSSCSEDSSIVSFDSTFEKEEQQVQEDRWIDVLVDNHSFSSSFWVGDTNHQTATEASKPVAAASPANYLVQLLREPSIGVLHREDFLDFETDVLSTKPAADSPPHYFL